MRNQIWYVKAVGLVAMGFMILAYQNCGSAERFSQAAVTGDGTILGGSSNTGPSAGSFDGSSGPTTPSANSSSPQLAAPSPTSCTTILQTTTENLRIIFMVDNSGSTASTDPKQFYRRQVVQEFLTTYGNYQNFQYAFGMFSTYGEETSFGNAASLSASLTAFETVSAGQTTNYDAAFSAIDESIVSVAKPGDGWKYVVVFMSDGQPKDLGSTATQQVSGISNLVNSLFAKVAALGSSATVSSVYFGPASDATAINNLNVMATLGGGQFVNTNITTHLVISDIITVPGQVCTSH